MDFGGIFHGEERSCLIPWGKKSEGKGVKEGRWSVKKRREVRKKKGS